MPRADCIEIEVEQDLPLEAVIPKHCEVIAALLPDIPVSLTAPQGQPQPISWSRAFIVLEGSPTIFGCPWVGYYA